jgi:hypothetical protein
MSMPAKESVLLLVWQMSIGLGVVFLLLVCPSALGTTYAPGTPITPVSIINPAENEVWLAGSDHLLTCTTSADTDLACIGGDWYFVDDSVTEYWTGSGTFTDNDNIGTSVTYICTTTAGINTVRVYADDDYAPDNNAALYNEDPSLDTETVTVVVPQLQWVEFGGGAKHTMYKKGPLESNPWNPGGEDYATDYTVAVPDRAWVRSPALTDPVCYTKNSTGGQVTASIHFTTPQALTEGSTVMVTSNDGFAHAFYRYGVGVSGTETTVPAMDYNTTLSNNVYGKNWGIAWYYWVTTGAYVCIPIGDSWNWQYRTWATPGGGDTVTAKRVAWACMAGNVAKFTITQAAEKVADWAHAGTTFARQQDWNIPIWKALDPSGLRVDCAEGAKLAVHGLRLLGIESAAQAWAFPTGGDPLGDKDASAQETTTCSNPDHGTIYLRYAQSPGG